MLGWALGEGPTMRLPTGKIIEGWPPDEAGEVLGPLVERCLTMRLHKRKTIEDVCHQMKLVGCWEGGGLERGPTMRLPQWQIIEVWPPDEAGEVLGTLVERCTTMRLHTRKHLKRWATR